MRSVFAGMATVSIVLVGLGCGVDGSGMEGDQPVAQRTDQLNFTLVGDAGTAFTSFVDGPAVSPTPSQGYPLARVPSNDRLQKLRLYIPAWDTALLPIEPFLGRPAVVSKGTPSDCDAVFVRRQDQTIGFAAQLNGGVEFGCPTASSTFAPLPTEYFVGAPAAASMVVGGAVRYDVFAPKQVGLNRNLRWITGSSVDPLAPVWGSWTADSTNLLPNTSAGVVSLKSGMLELFVCRSDNMLMWRTYFNNQWGPWTPANAGCYSTPSVAGTYSSKNGPSLKVVTLSAAGRIQVTSYTNATGWSIWTDLGPELFSGPPSLQKWGTGYRVWGKGADGNPYFGDF